MRIIRWRSARYIAMVLLCLGSSVSAEVHEYSGSMRLKYEYQHYVIDNVNIFLSDDEKHETQEEGDTSFCFADDIEEADIIAKKKKFAAHDIFFGEENMNGEEMQSDTTISIKRIDKKKIKNYVEENIVPFLNQDVHNVTISKGDDGNIIFDGYGQRGVSVNVDTTVDFIYTAILDEISYVNVDVTLEEPEVRVNNEELKQLGITELVAVGRSNFTGSSWKRITNVTNGASKFDGYIIPNDAIFSFNEQLGEIDKSTGFVPELVILGDKVVPEYGGGLCQVSSTVYRGAMLSGMEIVERYNHSYAVSYYEPHGSDATIYSPIKDFKFKNTSGNALLLQTRRGGHENNELFFHFYGTKPTARDVEILGPFVSNRRGPLASKTTYDPSLPEGSATVVSHSVSGLTTQFYRKVTENNHNLYNDYFKSIYQSRGYWVIRGGVDPATLQKEEVQENTDTSSTDEG